MFSEDITHTISTIPTVLLFGTFDSNKLIECVIVYTVLTISTNLLIVKLKNMLDTNGQTKNECNLFGICYFPFHFSYFDALNVPCYVLASLFQFDKTERL